MNFNTRNIKFKYNRTNPSEIREHQHCNSRPGIELLCPVTLKPNVYPERTWLECPLCLACCVDTVEWKRNEFQLKGYTSSSSSSLSTSNKVHLSRGFSLFHLSCVYLFPLRLMLYLFSCFPKWNRHMSSIWLVFAEFFHRLIVSDK